ncbi:kinase-like domain-containing protein, partial [Baffinella frigidus]
MPPRPGGERVGRPDLPLLDFSSVAEDRDSILDRRISSGHRTEHGVPALATEGSNPLPPMTPNVKQPGSGEAATLGTESKRVPRRREDIVGTPEYLAPEILLGIEHGSGVDWWALGVILFEFLVGLPPFTGDTPEKVFEHILAAPIPWHLAVDAELTPEARDLITQLLQRDPKRRLGARRGAGEVKQHPFFSSVKWSRVTQDEALTRVKQHPFFSCVKWSRVTQDEAVFVPSFDDPFDTSYFAPHVTRHPSLMLVVADPLNGGSDSSGSDSEQA